MTKDVDLLKDNRWFMRSTWCDNNHKLPLEVAIHRTVSAREIKPGDGPSPFIIPYRGFHLEEELKMYRLITAFAPSGDTFDFVTQFQIPASSEETYKTVEKIPHAYAWRFFLALVDAAIHISHCGVVHRDLTLENIFLLDETDGHNNPETAKMNQWCLRPQIGDFSSAMPIDPVILVVRNPEDFDGVGRYSHMAPEEYTTKPSIFPEVAKHYKLCRKQTEGKEGAAGAAAHETGRRRAKGR